MINVMYLFQKINNIKIALLLCIIIGSFLSGSKSYSDDSFNYHIPMPTDSRIRTVVYNPDEVYDLKISTEYQSIMQFSENEYPVTVFFGKGGLFSHVVDENSIMISASYPDQVTNMIIKTNKKRYYIFKLTSCTNDESDLDQDVLYKITFFYPEIDVDAPIKPKSIVPMPKQPQKNSPSGLNQNQDSDSKDYADRPKKDLNFNYSVLVKNANSNSSMLPKEAIDNSKFTYLIFKDNNINIPRIYSYDIKNKSEEELKWYRVGKYIIVKGVYPIISLRSKKEAMVVYNDKLVSELHIKNTPYPRINISSNQKIENND